MNAHYLRNFALTAVAIFLTAVTTLALQEATPQEESVQDSKQVAELFQKAKAEAAQIRRDSHDLIAYHRSRLSWQSHAVQLGQIKEHVNEVGELEQQLRDARESGSPWQQEAIDRINPLLQELADNLTSTINHLNEHRNGLFASPYPEYVRANADLADKLDAMIADFVDYGKTKEAFQELQNRLDQARS